MNMGELNTILGELGHIRRELQALRPIRRGVPG
jgi:hypothetical protein